MLKNLQFYCSLDFNHNVIANISIIQQKKYVSQWSLASPRSNSMFIKQIKYYPVDLQVCCCYALFKNE